MTIAVIKRGSLPVIRTGENTGEAARQANRATSAATAAETALSDAEGRVFPITGIGPLFTFYSAFPGLTIDIGIRRYLTIDPTQGVYPRKLTIPAAAVIDDQPTVSLLNRIAESHSRTIETDDYMVVGYTDDDGYRQIYARAKATGVRTELTSGDAHHTLDSVDADDRVIYYDAGEGGLRWVPITGGAGPFHVNATDTILFVGDSMMTAAGVGCQDEFIAQNPSRTVLNSAISGITAAKLAVLLDAAAHTVTVTGDAIPTSGSVTVTPSVLFLLGQPTATAHLSVRYRIAGVDGTLTWVPDGLGSGTHSFTPTDYPESPVAVVGAVPGKVLSLYVTGDDASAAVSIDDAFAGCVISGAGINDITNDGAYNEATCLAAIAAIKARRTSIESKDLHVTVTNGYYDLPASLGGTSTTLASEAESETRLERIDSFNAALAAAYPGEIADRFGNHVAEGASETVAVNGTNFTVLTMDPTSGAHISTDGRHENATGTTSTATLLTAEVTARSY